MTERPSLATHIEVRSITREFYEKLYAGKLDNPGEMVKFLETHKLLKLIFKNRKKQNISHKGLNIKHFVQRKTPNNMAPKANSTKCLKKNEHLSFTNSSEKNRKEGKFPNACYDL